MLTRLLWLALLLVIFWIVRRILRPATHLRSPSHGRPGAPGQRGRMVRDRECNTFVPRDRALVHRDREGEHYFCSEDCRTAFLTRGRTGPRPA